MEYSKVCLATLQFLSWLSGSYFHLSKDRLYCEAGDSRARQSGLSTLLSLTRSVTGLLSPVLPLLTEEAALSCPVLSSPFRAGWLTEAAWEADTALEQVSSSLEKIREELNKLEGVKVAESVVEVRVPGTVFSRLEGVASEEVAEVLGVLSARVVPGVKEEVVEVRRSEAASCLRCRRLVASPGMELCARCQQVVTALSL